MTKVGYLIDARYLLHDPGPRHPESPKRLIDIHEALTSYPSLNRWRRLEPRSAQPDELALIHHPSHIERVEKASRRAPSHLDPDTALSPESYSTALLAAGGVLTCMEEIWSGEVQRAFAFVRPPGHHAEPGRAMGFCLFNNVAIAAAYARVKYHLERIAVVDIDLHHGNGTQASFYDNPHLLYISSHQYPFYPGTGNFDEIGSGEGEGYTLNFPLPAGTGDETFVPLYSRIVATVLAQYKPQCVLVSAGFDAHLQDPLGGLCVTTEGYASAAASLVRAADQCCQGRILFVLEGGYSKEALQSCTKAVMAEMESDSPNDLMPPGDGLFQEISKHARRFVGDIWEW
jgi:acetoin utilization deacetylase AcuC-like enzyme